jgi:hypothetical protein
MFESLHVALADRDPYLTRISVEPIFDPFRSDPRYRVLMSRMNPEKPRVNAGTVKNWPGRRNRLPHLGFANWVGQQAESANTPPTTYLNFSTAGPICLASPTTTIAA